MNLVIICARYEQKAMEGQIGWIIHFVIFVLVVLANSIAK
jgi:hypothetical protein